jgi:hypothetical protein
MRSRACFSRRMRDVKRFVLSSEGCMRVGCRAVPLQVLHKYRQLMVDLNLEVADEGTCQLQLAAVQRQLEVLRGEASGDGGADALRAEAFADAEELHQALLHQAQVASRHKSSIRRRALFQQAAARKQQEKLKVLEEIKARKRELMQLEADADAVQGLDAEDGDDAGSGGGQGASTSGEVLRVAVQRKQADLLNMPAPALDSLCKRLGVRVPDAKDERARRVMAEKLVAQDAIHMRDAAKELRKVIGIPVGGRPENCDEFVLDDIEDGDEVHPSMAGPAHKGLRGRYLGLHEELHGVRRELQQLHHQETGYRLEYLTFHRSLRSREAISRRRLPKHAMESDERRALREMLEAAREAVPERLQHLVTLKDEAAKEAREIKEIEIQVTRFSRSVEYQGSALRLRLQNVARHVTTLRVELGENPGVELRGVKMAVPQVLRLLTVLSSGVHDILQHAQSFLTYVKSGGEMSGMAVPEAPELDPSIGTDLRELDISLAEEQNTLNRLLSEPLNNVRKVSMLQRSLHRLQHEISYEDYHNFCTRIAGKAIAPSRTPTIAETSRSKSILDSYTCSAVRLPKAPPSVASAQAAQRRAKVASKKAARLADEAASSNPSGLSVRLCAWTAQAFACRQHCGAFERWQPDGSLISCRPSGSLPTSKKPSQTWALCHGRCPPQTRPRFSPSLCPGTLR